MKHKKWIALTVGIVACLTCGAACGEEPSNAQIFLNLTTATVDYYRTLALNATVENSNESVVWSSSDESVAVVKDGVVTPTENGGSVTITATVEDVSASCVVEVVKSGYAPTLWVEQTEISLGIDDTFPLSPCVYYQDERLTETFRFDVALADGATNGVATAAVIDNQVAFVGISEGETVFEISTTVRDLPLVQRISVSVMGEDLVFLSDTLQRVEGGFALNLGLTETDEYQTSGTVEMSVYKGEVQQTDFNPTWSMSQTDAFSLDVGVVTALKEGTGTLTAEYQGETVTVYVNVVRPLIKRVETLTLETVKAETALSISLNGTVTGATLQKPNGTPFAFSVTYYNGVLLCDSDGLPKRAEDLGEQSLTVETDKAKYQFPVSVYTMIIRTETDLNAFIPTAKEMGNGTFWTGYFVLGGDVVCTGEYVSQWNGERNGTASTAEAVGFNGVFDGHGYAIYNLHTVGETGGLIPCLNAGGVLKNLSVVDGWNTGNGGFIVSHCCGRIENVYVSTSVKGAGNTRAQKVTSAFVSDVVSTARINKVFVDVLEKTGDKEYCNPFYVMHEKYAIVNGMYAIGVDSLWSKVENVGTLAENADCGAFENLVAMKQAGVSTASWVNGFWKERNGLPYPELLDLPDVSLKLTLSVKKAKAEERVEIVEISENTLVTLSDEATAQGVTIDGNEIVLSKDVQAGTVICVYARNVYNPAEYFKTEIVVIGENDLQDGEFDNDDAFGNG